MNVQTNFKNMQEFWAAVDSYMYEGSAIDELKQAAFCRLLIAELSSEVDSLNWKLAIERAKLDMKATIIPDLRK